MIEYTINPDTYDVTTGNLRVEVVPVDDTLGLFPQVIVVFINPGKVIEILELQDVAAQKAIIRKEVLKFNTIIQNNWQNMLLAYSIVIPPALTDLLGVPGTTAVTEAEIDANQDSATWEFSSPPVIIE
tara:strand:+ start:739 stop:1122 length:384 start_codon:yes stop_codon:yes gene_type:complete